MVPPLKSQLYVAVGELVPPYVIVEKSSEQMGDTTVKSGLGTGTTSTKTLSIALCPVLYQ